jgi:hypothetical protein
MTIGETYDMYMIVDPEFDETRYDDVLPDEPSITMDEWTFIQWCLERWHDRAFKHLK